MTRTMKAIVLGKFGGVDAFELRDVAVPAVGPRQVRVRVYATAINPLDLQIRRSDYADNVPLNRGKLDALTTLVGHGLIKPVIGAALPLARIGEAHELLEGASARGLCGKVAIDVVGQTVKLPALYNVETIGCSG